MQVYLSKVRLNRGGYTDKGYYLGTGQQVWEYQYAGDDCSHYIRARNRESAKEIIRGRLKHLLPAQPKFYR